MTANPDHARDHPVARMQIALQLVERQPGAAYEQAAAILRDHPDLPAAYRVLALACRRLGKGGEADRLELQSIVVALQHPGLQSASKAISNGRFEDAESAVRAYLRRDPEDPGAALMLGNIAAHSGARREAENLFRRAIMLAPAYAEARLALAMSQRETGDYPAAMESLTALLEREPTHLAALALKALIQVQLRHYDEGEETYRTLLAHHPQDGRGWMNFAFLLKTIGRRDEAITAYRQSVALDPTSALAWWGLANLKTVRFSLEDIAAMRAMLEKSELPDDDRLHLLYALGKALDDNQIYNEAFEVYQQGATLRLEKTPYDPARASRNVRRVEQTLTREFFAARRDWGCAEPDPIFIVSLPRSGSTLVEQILASHPLVEGTEELFDIERIAADLAPGQASGTYVETIASLSREKVRALGEHYIEATSRVRRSGKPFFTDKMPSNWVFTGLIHLILPRARIIDVRRHPLGCGLANFAQHFNWGINFSYDLKHIGSFYRAYVRQMAHFDDVLPGRIHRIFYERLVDDLEAEVRRLLDYLGLPFDEACLRFFDNPRAVLTPSSEQVRSPINRAGMDRWRHYQPWLGPLEEALGPVLNRYPEVPPLDADW